MNLYAVFLSAKTASEVASLIGGMKLQASYQNWAERGKGGLMNLRSVFEVIVSEAAAVR